jgi:hypothetical protein
MLAIAWLMAMSLPLGAQTGLVLPYLQNATPTRMVIMWETNVNSESIVEYGLTAALGSSTAGTSINTSGGTVLHTVTLTGLNAGTGYFYKAKTGSWQSATYDFVTPPLPSSEANFNIVLMSDMQKDGGNPNIFSNLINTSLLPYIANTYGTPLSDHLHMAMLPGDVVDNGNSYLQYKNDLFNPGQALWSYVPSYPAIGNHEANSIHYFNYYNLPLNGTAGYLEHWYTHDYSNVRVLSFDSNPTYRIAAQLTWLDSVLNATCNDPNIDFVFAQMHHPFLSELWTPGETDYTGEIVERMEAFSDLCGKPSVHFFGHTHAYSRGQSRDHEHLWVNVATAGGNIDYWGEFDNEDYDEFIISQDEYGFVMVEVTAGPDPSFRLKRLSFGDQYNPGGSEETDMVFVRKNNAAPNTPTALFPLSQDTVSPVCLALKADGFADPDGETHGSSHWQVSLDSSDFTAPLFETWKQYANWYNEEDLQANDDLTDVDVTNLPSGETLWWRVRYRDQGLAWSDWSAATRFMTTPLDTLSANLVLNPGAESGIVNWQVTIGVIESLNPLQCAGINPYAGVKYFAVGALCVEHPFASAFQNIEVSTYAQPIDSGNVLVNYGAYLADYANTDEPSFALQFLNASNVVIGGTDTIRHQTEVWTLKQATVSIPVGTRTIRFILMGKRNAGVDNDSYFDEIFLRLLQGDLSCDAYVSPGDEFGRIYVDQDATAFPDGESWTTAYRTIGDAIAQSNTDVMRDQIWIAEGMYPVTTTADRDSTNLITRSIAMYGGFAGDETAITQRDIEANVTTLTGEIGNPNTQADNSYHVLYYTNTLDTNRIDGLHICCGYADQPGFSSGGGLYYAASNREPLYIHESAFEGNAALEGSSIFNAGQMQLSNTVIEETSVPGVTSSSILNTGVFADLHLLQTTITQICTSCGQVIRNVNEAKLTIQESTQLQQD